jgi:hypothetical protein
MDDIWGGYIAQQHFKNAVIYNRASVYQARNPQDLITNLEKEILGYRNTYNFIHSNCDLSMSYIPEQTRLFYKLYQDQFK